MTRRAILIATLFATACSGAPNVQNGQDAQAAAKPAGDDALPKNSPLEPDIKNVAATTGHANLPTSKPPFAVTTLGDFDEPFAMAFLPDGRLLVTEKAGHLQMRATDGSVKEVAFPPTVAKVNQGGLLDVALAPDFATSHGIYLTYSEPGDGGAALALMHATLRESNGDLALVDKNVIWRSGSNGPGGQFGANILFSPDHKYIFLTSGERQRFTPAQDPKQALGKILRLTLDGKAAPGNPMYDKGGVEAMTWSSGHRNPYGQIFAPDGRHWEVEMGPRGGDELNLILPGKNYGWPIVSNGDNYSGQPIPDHPSRPDLEAPKLWWNPSISPGGLIQYSGKLFPQFDGNLLLCALSGEALIRIKIDGDKATALDQWDMGTRMRDIAQAPDGSIWVLEDGEKGAGGKLLRLAPKS